MNSRAESDLGGERDALERIAYREQCEDAEAEEMRLIARRALGWQISSEEFLASYQATFAKGGAINDRSTKERD